MKGFSALWVFAGAGWGLALGLCELHFGAGLVDYSHMLESQATFGAGLSAEPVFGVTAIAAGLLRVLLVGGMAAFIAVTWPNGWKLIRILIPAGLFAGLGLAGWFAYWLLFAVLPLKGVG